jgi:hypothetical protein
MNAPKRWSEKEIALVRAAIINNVEDVKFLSNALGRSEGSIYCKLGRERMTMSLEPIYTGKTIGYNPQPKISI